MLNAIALCWIQFSFFVRVYRLVIWSNTDSPSVFAPLFDDPLAHLLLHTEAISLLVDYASLCPYSNSLTSFRRLFFAGDLLASGRLRAFWSDFSQVAYFVTTLLRNSASWLTHSTPVTLIFWSMSVCQSGLIARWWSVTGGSIPHHHDRMPR